MSPTAKLVKIYVTGNTMKNAPTSPDEKFSSSSLNDKIGSMKQYYRYPRDPHRPANTNFGILIKAPIVTTF
jgi:hypothetical protein